MMILAEQCCSLLQGDQGGMGLGMTVGMVVQDPEFLDNPHLAAKKVWIKLQKNAAPNGAVMRTSILGGYL